MKFKELNEAKVNPDLDLIHLMSQIIDDVNREYQEFLDENGDQDDIDHLADLLNDEVEHEELPIVVHVNHEPRKDPNEYISAQASWAGDDDKGIDIILHAKNLEGTWGPKTFKQILLSAIKHETIHFGQYDKIGKEKLGKIKSGHQKGTELVAKGGTHEDWLRKYLEDPHELMAYGHDLAQEIKDEDNPEQVLRNPEKYIDVLPTYKRFRSVFDRNSKEIKQLLRYAAAYFKGE